MKTLIIGSKGFIGINLYDYFKSLNNDVWGADIFPGIGANYFQLEKKDTSFDEVFRKENFDLCINASGNGSVPISLNQPVFDFNLNVTNTIKILDAIREHNSKCKFVNLSSAAVYGNPMSLPVKENMELKPLSPYGWHKYYAELICKEYYYLHGISTINLRLFSVYGEHLKKQLFWDIYQKCTRVKTVELFGSGNETRDFIYIKDFVEAVDYIIKHGTFSGEAINVASGVETTIKVAASIFCDEYDSTIEVLFNNMVKPGDPLHWQADISLLQSFGFKAKYSIKNGLKNTMTWLKENK